MNLPRFIRRLLPQRDPGAVAFKLQIASNRAAHRSNRDVIAAFTAYRHEQLAGRK